MGHYHASSPRKTDMVLAWKGGLCITPLLHFMRSQIYKYGLQYLNSNGPSQSNESVHLALTSLTTNWLQESFVDSVHALGGRCHGFGPWNPCPVRTLCSGEEIHVEFDPGRFSGSVLTYDENRASALIPSHVDCMVFHVTDRHTCSLHPTSNGPALPWSSFTSRWPPPFSLLHSRFPQIPSLTLHSVSTPMRLDTSFITLGDLTRCRCLT